MKPSDFEDISFSKVLHFIQDAGLLNESAKVLHKTLITVKVPGSLSSCPSVFYSILLGHIPPSQNTTQHPVLTLCDKRKVKGHNAYMDRWFSSPKIFDHIWAC